MEPSSSAAMPDDVVPRVKLSGSAGSGINALSEPSRALPTTMQYFVGEKEFLGLTDRDLRRFETVRHWAAGIHYWKRRVRAKLPGSIHIKPLQSEFFNRLKLPPDPLGEWTVRSGALFGCWWFLGGADIEESITIVNLLGQDALW